MYLCYVGRRLIQQMVWRTWRVRRAARSRQFGDVYQAPARWWSTGLAVREAAAVGQGAVPWPKMAAVLVAARLCEPSQRAAHRRGLGYQRTALCDLLRLNADLAHLSRPLSLRFGQVRLSCSDGGSLIQEQFLLEVFLIRKPYSRSPAPK